MDKKERLGFMNFLKKLINIVLFLCFSIWIYLLVIILQFIVIIPFWLFSKKSYSYYWISDFWEYADLYGGNFWEMPFTPK